MQMMSKPEGYISSYETDHAALVLRYLDHKLLDKLDEDDRAAYHEARHALGQIARTNRVRLFPGGPYMHMGFSVPVTGSGDEAHGHTRLRRLIETVVLRLYEEDKIDTVFMREIYQLMRGYFSDLRRKIEVAIFMKNK